VTRTQALQAAAGIIARDVPDLAGLCALLEYAGQLWLAAALRARAGEKTAVVGGAARPDAEVWAEATRRAVGVGR
jgi:hypothetical protein